MPNYKLAKNLNLCLSLLKRPQPQITNHSPQHHHSLNNTSQPHHHQNNSHPFIKNYNSLYEDFSPPLPPPPNNPTSAYNSAPASPSSVSTDYMETEDDIMAAGAGSTTPDLTAVYASRRFFISSPGRSNSIVDSLSLSSSNLLLSPAEEASPSSSSSSVEVAGGVPIQTYSPDPYVDFRKSMQEMVEARELGSLEVKEAWEYLQELLLSYLALNPKNTHKYIVGAFTDLVVTLMSPSNNICDSSSSSFNSSHCEGDQSNHHHNGGSYV